MKYLALILILILGASPINGYSQTAIKMENRDGVYYVPCSVNGLNLQFIFDTGAGDVSISLSEALFMLKNGYMQSDDLISTQKYQIANGDIAEGTKINIRELKIGDRTLYNVEASIVHSLTAPLLLGESAIKRFGTVTIDYTQNLLYLGANNSNNNGNTSKISVTTSIPDYVPKYGLVGWWPFNGNTNDASGNGHDCSNYGCQLRSDRFGQQNSAYYFSNTYMIANNTSDLVFYEATINVWFCMKSIPKENISFVSKYYEDNPESSFMLGWTRWNETKVGGGCWVKGPAKNGGVTSAGACAPTEDFENWHMLTMSNKNGIWKIYLDGNYSQGGPWPMNSSNNFPIVFGNHFIKCSSCAPTTVDKINAYLDDIAIYNRELSAEEISRLFNGK